MASTTSQLTLDLADEAATAQLAEDIAARVSPGDIIGLSGGLGAGKTTFARAFIRALANDPELEVPSPTFTLAQTYAVGQLTLTHCDFYRLGDPSEIDELGLADATENGAVIVEWPERADDRLPTRRLMIEFAMAGKGRRVTLTGEAAIFDRFARSLVVRDLLDHAGWLAAARQHIAGDASLRIYERIATSAASAILMDWPPGGQLAATDPRRKFRAHDVTAFLAVDEGLRATGLSSPRIFAVNRNAGLLLMEDFGTEGLIAAERPMLERYRVVVEALSELHNAPRPAILPIPGGGTHALKRFSGDALFAELALFADWYAPHARGANLSDRGRRELFAIWQTLDARLSNAEQSWVLFDVQSANLFWLPARQGIAHVGFIDFQDMFFGPAAYDVASLVFDARINVSAELAHEIVAHYLAARRATDSSFDPDSFKAAFAVCGALRTMKNMGAFARFARNGKPQYIKYLNRLSLYLERLFTDPVLSPLALWYERHLPS